jgi:hypothetical protein
MIVSVVIAPQQPSYRVAITVQESAADFAASTDIHVTMRA